MHLRSLIQRHVKYTSSTVGRHILLDWDTQHRHFVKVGSTHCYFFLLELGWLLNRSGRTGTPSTATLQGGWGIRRWISNGLLRLHVEWQRAIWGAVQHRLALRPCSAALLDGPSCLPLCSACFCAAPPLPATSPLQVWPREFRRALDDSAKLKAAQAAEAEVLKGASNGGPDAFEQLKTMAAEGGCGWVAAQQGGIAVVVISG